MSDLLSDNGYTWPSKYPKPMDHQRVTAEFLVQNKRSFCLNGIGSAKTLSALWAADFLMNHKVIRKVLISAPLSTLWSVWSDEIFLNIYGRSAVVLHGSKEKRKKLLQENHDFYIINHEGVQVIMHDLLAKEGLDLVIVDEGAKLRNGQKNKWKSHNLLAGPHTSKGMWWMTGSPMPKAPTDVWAQARIVNPSTVPKYFTRFRNEMMVKVNMYKWMPVRGWRDRCFRILQPSIRFKREDCIDLPPCTTQTHQVEMSKDQRKAYAEMLRTFRATLKEGTVTALNESARRIKIMQLAAGAVYDGNEFTHFLDCRPKLKTLADSIEAADNKAIVFVSFRHSIELLRDSLLKKGLTVGVVFGGTAVAERRALFQSFQHGDLQILLAHPGCMAHGLTLTAAATIIWWAPVDSYETYSQANGRISRPGQTAKQTIIHLVCSDIERKIYARLQRRERMEGLLLELLEEK